MRSQMTDRPATDHASRSRRMAHSSWRRLRMVSQLMDFRRVLARQGFVQHLRYNANHVTGRTRRKLATVRAPTTRRRARSRRWRAGLLRSTSVLVAAKSAVGLVRAQARVAARAGGLASGGAANGFAIAAALAAGGGGSPGWQAEGVGSGNGARCLVPGAARRGGCARACLGACDERAARPRRFQRTARSALGGGAVSAGGPD